MNKLKLSIIVLSMLIATSAQGDYSVYADTLEIMINGNLASGQEFNVGDTITITCDVIASASASNVYGALKHRASVDSALELYQNTVLLTEDTYYIEDEGSSGASVSVNETLSITYTLTELGLYTIDAFSDAGAFYYTGGWFPLDHAYGGPVSLTFSVVAPSVIDVDIDIKPGSFPNPINQGSNGVIPVAIFSSSSFDATTVLPETVFLGGLGVAVRGKGSKYMAHNEDVNGDGWIDLLVQVETAAFDQIGANGEVILIGETSDGTSIEGVDVVVIVPPE